MIIGVNTMRERAHNFCAGPCTLPLETLEAAKSEFVDYHNTGMSLIEMSHRSKEYDLVHMEALALTRSLFQVPDDFSILFIQGGASIQFGMVPMNLLKPGERGAYVNSGSWAKGAITDAAHYGEIYTAWDGSEDNYRRMPESSEIELEGNTRYLHITSNETIGGIHYPHYPKADVPLIADISSDFMSRPLPWEQFDLVYGGAQKNLGPSGLGVVILRRTLLENNNRNMARYLRYDIHDAKDSLFNTPPVFAIWMMGKTLSWMKQKGGLAAMASAAAEKSNMLYSAIDNSEGFYNSPVDPSCRSQTNVVFRLGSEEQEKNFITEATAAGLYNLKGHRSVGGCRASLYNALPMKSVIALVDFMADFKQQH